MKVNKLLIGLATCTLLASCAAPNPSSDASSDASNDSNMTETSQEGSTGSVDTGVEESYSVKVINATDGVTLTSDKARAVAGDAVIITVTINDPSYRVSKVLCDGVECTKLSDNKYTFIMPDHPVKVTCETILDGDVTIQGQISAAFIKQGDLYVAKGVKVSKDSNFDVVVKDKKGEMVKLNVTDIDRFKTFADVSFSQGAVEQNLTIAGGSTYDFYYDVNNGDKPLYIKRVSVDVLPSSARGVYGLFGGTIRSASSVNPDNLVSLKFRNELANEDVTWTAFNDNSAYGRITSKDVKGQDVEKGVYYASLTNDRLDVVDSFTPGNNPKYDNASFAGDKLKFSGHYKVSDVDAAGNKTDNNEFVYKNSFVNESVAQSCVNLPIISMQAFENEIMRGYRVGFVKEDAITQALVKIDSVDNKNGTFTTTIKSSNTYDSTQDRNHSGPKVNTHYEYRSELVFSDAGALLEGRYEYKTFGDDLYDFNVSNPHFITGDADSNYSKGKLENEITISYTYGEKGANNVNFNKDPYFVSEIKNVKILNPNASGSDANRVNIGDAINGFVEAGFEPQTALNAYQYSITSSSNSKVIAEEPYKGFVAKSEGKSDITIGIINGLGVTSTVSVSVVGGQLVRSFFLNTRWQKFQEITSSDSANVYTGQENEFGLDCNSGKNKPMPIPLDATLEIVGDAKGFKARINHENQTLIIDGTAAIFDQSTKFSVKVLTPSYDPDWSSCHPSTFTFTILKGIEPTVLVGTWNAADEAMTGASVTFTLDKSGDETYIYKGSIVSSEGNFDFIYSFNSKRNQIKSKLVGKNVDLCDLELIYDSETQILQAFLVVRDWTVESGQTVTEVFGWEDGENKFYDTFKKA